MAIVLVEHSPSAGAGRLGTALRDHGHRLRVIRTHAGAALPADLDDVDGLVSCGGPQAPTGDEPWLAAEVRCLQAAHERALPIVGICLGCQLLARALGGEVGPLAAGIELGWHEVTLTDSGREDVLHAGIAWKSMQPAWHRYGVTRPPPGARVLARSARTPVQAWALGLRTYAFQYHPEIDARTLETWARESPQDLAEAGTTAERLAQETARHGPAFERLTDRLFESIALYLMPADRRIRGVVRDLHH